MIDDLNYCVRQLVRRVMAMPDNSVRPAGQIAPTGTQVAQFATVDILEAPEVGSTDRSLVTVDDVTNEALDSLYRFTVSVNFYKGTAADAAGIAQYNNTAFDLASRLPQRLELSESILLMQQLGIQWIGASKPRNLRRLIDATWEGRGQIDLYFTVVNRELAPIGTFESVDVGLNVQEPDGTIQHRDIEVTT